MEIRVLRYFLTVAREESITRAAEVLHITQPTLSRQLSQLEEETGVRLLERGPRRIRLTSEGMLLRRRAEEILELVDKTEAELSEQDELVEGRISVGCGELASVSLLPELFRSFRERYPRVGFDLYTATADLVMEHVTGMRVEDAERLTVDDVLALWGGLQVGRTRRGCVELPLTVLKRALALLQ